MYKIHEVCYTSHHDPTIAVVCTTYFKAVLLFLSITDESLYTLKCHYFRRLPNELILRWTAAVGEALLANKGHSLTWQYCRRCPTLPPHSITRNSTMKRTCNENDAANLAPLAAAAAIKATTFQGWWGQGRGELQHHTIVDRIFCSPSPC